MIRVFVCIELSENLQGEITNQLNCLRSINTRVRWVDQMNLHITLKFLGDMSKDRVDTVVQAVQLGSRDSSAFVMNFDGVGAFPSMANPRVLWIGVTRGREELGALASRIDAQLSHEGFPRESRGFTPHLTIGRVKSLENTDEIGNVLFGFEQVHFGEMKVDAITVMESKLCRNGPVYSPIRRVYLRP